MRSSAGYWKESNIYYGLLRSVSMAECFRCLQFCGSFQTSRLHTTTLLQIITAMQLSRLDVFIPDQLYRNPVSIRIGYASLYYCLCFEVVAHMYISINRYTAIARPILHQTVCLKAAKDVSTQVQIWKGNSMKLIVVSLFVLPIPAAVIYACNEMSAITFFNADGTRYHVPKYASENLALVRRAYSWRSSEHALFGYTFQIATAVPALYNVFTASLSIILELRTLYVYRSMAEALRKSRRDDYRLLSNRRRTL